MSVDLRGFNYSLEPLRRQLQWRLDSMLARLGKIQNAIHHAQETLNNLRATHASQSQEASRAILLRLNPEQHALCLLWLASLQADILVGDANLRELETERTTVSAQCLAQQQKLDVVELHRKEAVADFTRLELGRLATEADRDWQARAAFRRLSRRMNTPTLLEMK